QDVFTLAGGRSGSSALAFSRDGALLAVAGTTSRAAGVRLFRLDSGEELAGFDTESVPVSALAFDPSGKRLAIGLGPLDSETPEREGEVRIWRTDLEKAEPGFAPFPLAASLGVASALAFSPDGQFLLVAHARGFVRVLDARAGREVGFLN